MINVSADALEALDAFFTAKPDSQRVVRLFVAPGGCFGPVLNMAPDQVDEGDITASAGDITFCMAGQLFERVGELTVEMDGEKFVISSERPLVDPSIFAGCSCCSGSCGSNGR